MGEAKANDAALDAALKGGVIERQIKMTHQQGAAMFCLQEAVAMCAMKADTAKQLGQADVEKALRSASEHLQKALARFIDGTQNKVMLATPG